jgi:hypothetical protein
VSGRLIRLTIQVVLAAWIATTKGHQHHVASRSPVAFACVAVWVRWSLMCSRLLA